MEVERKWFLLSRTFLVNVFLAWLLSRIEVRGQVEELMRNFGLEELKNYVVALYPLANAILRFFSWNTVGSSDSTRPWYKSKTVIVNVLMLIGAFALLYIRLSEGGNIQTALILIVVALGNIYLRVTLVKKKLTLLPGIFGRII